MELNTLGTILILAFAGLLFLLLAFGLWTFTQNRGRIKANFISEDNRITTKKIKLDKKDTITFDFEDGSYKIDKDAMKLSTNWRENNMPTFFYLKGNPNPITFDRAELLTVPAKKGAIQPKPRGHIDAKGLKRILMNKLFYDLFNSDAEKMKDMLLIIAVVIIIAGIAFLVKLNMDLPKVVAQAVYETLQPSPAAAAVLRGG